ncbi:MAG: hypothetical protein OHK0015_03210 [Chloroflexi bacterium OHK40]
MGSTNGGSDGSGDGLGATGTGEAVGAAVAGSGARLPGADGLGSTPGTVRVLSGEGRGLGGRATGG